MGQGRKRESHPGGQVDNGLLGVRVRDLLAKGTVTKLMTLYHSITCRGEIAKWSPVLRMLDPVSAHFRGNALYTGGPCWCPIPTTTAQAFAGWKQLQEVTHVGRSVMVCEGTLAVRPAPPVPHRIEVEFRHIPCKPWVPLIVWRTTLEDLYQEPDMNEMSQRHRDYEFETCAIIRPVACSLPGWTGGR